MPLQALVQRNPITLPLNASVLEVARTLRLMGMLTTSDLMRQQSTSPVDLARNIHRQSTLEGLVGIGHQVKALQNHLSAANTSAYQTGHIITTRALCLGGGRLARAVRTNRQVGPRQLHGSERCLHPGFARRLFQDLGAPGL
jgi:hypothetical protein